MRQQNLQATLVPQFDAAISSSAQVQGAVYAEDWLCHQGVMMDATSSLRNNDTNREPMPISQLPIRNRDQGNFMGSFMEIWESRSTSKMIVCDMTTWPVTQIVQMREFQTFHSHSMIFIDILTGAKRREFSGMIPVITSNNHPSNPATHPFHTCSTSIPQWIPWVLALRHPRGRPASIPALQGGVSGDSSSATANVRPELCPAGRPIRRLWAALNHLGRREDMMNTSEIRKQATEIHRNRKHRGLDLILADCIQK